MAILPSIASPIVVARAPPWSRSGGLVIKRPYQPFPDSASREQNEAQLALTEAARAARGSRGRMVVANAVKARTGGKDYGGARNAETRRRNAYAAADATASTLQRLIANKRGGGASAAGGGGPASFF